MTSNFRPPVLLALAALSLGWAFNEWAVDAVRADDPERGMTKTFPGSVAGRSGELREKLLKEGGGNTASEAAVAGGLKWLERHQFADGHWGLHNFSHAAKCTCGGEGTENDVAGTALALLPFLGAGETHKGEGKNNRYAKTVQKALQWLLAKQAADGQLGDDGFAHGLAALALCEAYDQTSDPALKAPAQRAVKKIVEWQGKNGGFGSAAKDDGNTTLTAWHLQALKAAQKGGLNVPQETITGINRFLDQVSANEGSSYGDTKPNQNDNLGTTAMGLYCRQHLGWGPRTPGLTKGIVQFQDLPPKETKDLVYYYYATNVMYHMGAVQPEAWEKWNVPMRDLLITSQDKGATADHRDQKGSWDPKDDKSAKQLGRLGQTSLSLLTLEVYYRHLPLYRREIPRPKEEK